VGRPHHQREQAAMDRAPLEGVLTVARHRQPRAVGQPHHQREQAAMDRAPLEGVLTVVITTLGRQSVRQCCTSNTIITLYVNASYVA
jgi:hypothetical protein